ncbi:MAG: CBS domain-containing protein [Methylomonas sp.]|jgi:CBS domain-containing protein
MINKISVDDFMTTKIISVTPDTDVSQAVKLLLDNKVTSLPVLDEQHKLLGVFSEIDGMKMVIECSYNQMCLAKVGDVMNKTPETVDSQDSIVDVAIKFQNTPTRSFAVFKNDQLVGMISRADVLKSLMNIR